MAKINTIISFVIPWFAPDIPGGAEQACRSLALHFVDAGAQVEILSTCIRQFDSDWTINFYPVDTEVWKNITIRRFPVQPVPDQPGFARVNEKLITGQTISAEEEQLFWQAGVYCPQLADWQRENSLGRVFIHIPYLFSTSILGVDACPTRSVLIPCLHNESYAHTQAVRDMFGQCAAVIFLSREEAQVAKQLYPGMTKNNAVLGLGLDDINTADPERFRRQAGLSQYILYAGRKDGGKNTPLLIDCFCRYKATHRSDVKLALIGPGHVQIPAGFADDVLDFGFVTQEEKFDAMAGALALCQPSCNESFSIVAMESWLCNTPVLVHAGGQVLTDHVKAASGGLWFATAAELAACIEWFRNNPVARHRMGTNGAIYVRENYSWSRVTRRYLEYMQSWGLISVSP